MVELNSRFNNEGLKTIFPQLGIEYALTKWLKSSLEYRFVGEKNNYGNFKSSSSIRTNFTFRKSKKRFRAGLRLRYQYSFSHQVFSSYNEDFDQAFRFRPFIEYDINNFILTPVVNTEFFYNPEYGPKGRQFTKVRYTAGFKLDSSSPHNVSLRYRLDQSMNRYPVRFRHILSLKYGYAF